MLSSLPGRRIVAPRHLRAELLQDARIRASAGERRRDPLGADAGALGERDRLGDRLKLDRAQDLVDELRRLARSDRPHQRVVRRQPAHHRSRPFEIGFLAAGHDGQPARQGAGRAAGERAIDPSAAGRLREIERRAPGSNSGSIDDMSISKVSAFAALATPSGPNTAASTIFAELRLVMTKGASRAASAAESAGTRPFLRRARASSTSSRSKTITSRLVSSSRVAIAPPMTPTPTTATETGGVVDHVSVPLV